jgi:hypothetical protein
LQAVKLWISYGLSYEAYWNYINNRRFVELKSARKVGFMNSSWNWVNLGFTDLDTHCILLSLLQRHYLMVSKWFSIYCTDVSILKQVMTTNFPAESFSMPMPFCPMLLLMMLTLAHDLFSKSSVHTNKALINPYLYYFLCRKFPTQRIALSGIFLTSVDHG